MRIDKLLAHCGWGSRKEVKNFISKGLVKVNGNTIKKVGFLVNPDEDQIELDGQTILYERYAYYVLNKPQGVISATEDDKHLTVLDCLGPEYDYLGLFPVGRLDIDTTGLLLLTNNGQLSHRLLSPKHHVDKGYEAWVEGQVTLDMIEAFDEGLDLGDFTSLPASLKALAYDEINNKSHVYVTIQEGKFHQVKRMFEKVGSKVVSLNRISMGPLKLDEDLEVGDFRPLTQAEKDSLKPYGLDS